MPGTSRRDSLPHVPADLSIHDIVESFFGGAWFVLLLLGLAAVAWIKINKD